MTRPNRGWVLLRIGRVSVATCCVLGRVTVAIGSVTKWPRSGVSLVRRPLVTRTLTSSYVACGAKHGEHQVYRSLSSIDSPIVQAVLPSIHDVYLSAARNTTRWLRSALSVCLLVC